MKGQGWLYASFLFGGFACGGVVGILLDRYESRVEESRAHSSLPPVSMPAEKAQAVGDSDINPQATSASACQSNGLTVCEDYGMVKDEPRCIKLPKETAYDCLRWAGVLAASFSDKECLTPDDVAVLRPMAQACRVALPALRDEKR